MRLAAWRSGNISNIQSSLQLIVQEGRLKQKYDEYRCATKDRVIEGDERGRCSASSFFRSPEKKKFSSRQMLLLLQILSYKDEIGVI